MSAENITGEIASLATDGSENDEGITELKNITEYGLTLNGFNFNTSIDISDLIESGKFQIMNDKNLNKIPNLPGNYWILTDEPIKHSLNPDFNHRPSKVIHDGIEYNIIYNGQGDTIRTRINAHLYRPKTKGLGDMSGISIDITDKYQQGTKISHNKCLFTQGGKKIPYHECKQQQIEYDDLRDFYGDDDLEEVKEYCKDINEESTIYFKNGIDITEEKHRKYSWLVVYYDMNKLIYHPFSDVIEQEWRRINGSPILCSYKCGR